MHRLCLGVLVGCLLSLFLPVLPAFSQIIFLLLILCCGYWRSWFFAGFFLYLLSWHWQLADYLKSQQHLLGFGHSYYQVEIVEISVLTDSTQLQVKFQRSEAAGYLARVSWHQAPPLRVGEQWRLPLQLKRPQSRFNPGMRNIELQFLVSGILAEGYVNRTLPAIKLKANRSARPVLLDRLEPYFQDRRTSALLKALTTGQRDFSPQLWQGLKNSGLGHLLVISGLHISLVYGWSVLLLQKILRLQRWRYSTDLSWVVALLPTLAFVWLAGFAIPTLRAAIALLILLVGRLLIRPASLMGYWCLLCSSLLLVAPFWALSVSFWLSILAVGFILFVVWLLGAPAGSYLQKVKYFLLFHLLLTSLMSLLTLTFFSGFSLLAWLSNMLFVPWCTLVAIPTLLLTLSYTLLGLPYADWLWQLADILLTPLWLWLDWTGTKNVWWSLPHLQRPLSLVLTFGLLAMLMLRPSKPIWCLAATTLVLVVVPASTTAPRLTLLDAGQRTILLIRQPGLSLLYLDIPAEFAEQAIRQQLLPLLQYYQVRQLTAVVWPGARPAIQPAVNLLQQYYPRLEFYSAIASDEFLPCSVLAERYPKLIRHWVLPEDDPCSLSIDLNNWQLLMPGNLSQQTEQRLLQLYPELSADLYLLADYGRQSVNSLAFLQHLAPVQLLLAAESRGRHRYPVKVIRQRLTLLNLSLYHSGEEGAIEISFYPEYLLWQAERQRRWPRWLEKPTE
ncbi:ComEC/Rec2 family competence protein [Alishewanella jeotgali]|uniref:DNA internalization-related competence protein ComEC/Rec2 n=1 Tax=Alishewanella jeotgali KCTC 22429 TaxID=1129374 RepID=H3ZIY1_9ALTE|nr:DNA internalization-related competence protein ComEC/Rec2 [Alishewanella jeotgali KCTC 22429]